MARWSNAKHRWLALVGGISLLIWGLSGLTHVAMVLFGPQQAQFMPPASALDLQGARPVAEIFADAGIARAVAVRTVASQRGTLLQVTSDPLQPRRYFDPATGAELPGYDRQQAEFLARHFLAERRPIAAIDLQTAFDADYPWVNRLLPVWRVRFAGDDRLTAYIHTETTSVAAVNNRTKTWLQTAFRYFHSWEWVPVSMDWLRVLVITAMVGSLAVLAVTGTMMLIAIRRKKRLPGSRGWHRAAGYVFALPLLLFSVSGIYHLIQNAITGPGNHLRMAQPLDVSGQRFAITEQWDALTAGLAVESLSLVEGAGGRPLYRLGLAADAPAGGGHDHGGGGEGHGGQHAMPQTAGEIRNARFEGIQPSGPALYIDAATGTVAPEGDREVALLIANRLVGASAAEVTGMEMVTRFGTDYDFRNKRLPVWRVDYGAPHHASVFVDTATGTLVDRVADWQKPELWSFSFLHKWNFLHPLGRVTMNAIVAGFAIALVVLMAGLGLAIRLRGQRRQSSQSPRVRS
jgi:hypothetical protein